MGIKNKQKGPSPAYAERWQNLAMEPSRTMEAVSAYREVHPKVSPVNAAKIVREFRNSRR